MSDDAKKPLGKILLRQKAVTQPQLDEALKSAAPSSPPLASRLIEQGALTEIAALKALSEQSGVPGIDLNQVCIKLADLQIVPREVATRHKLLPVLVRDDRVFVAMASPTEKRVVDEIEFVTGKRVFPYIALAGPLMRVIQAAYEMRDRGEDFYVGPQCPPEIMRRMGYTPKAQDEGDPWADSTGRAPLVPPQPSAAQRPAPPARPTRSISSATFQAVVPEPSGRISDPDSSFKPASNSGRPTPQPPKAAPQPRGTPVVVDDAMQRMAVADELTDADFGLVDRDVSRMASLPEMMVQPARPPPAKEGQRTILVVDDEADIRKLLKRILDDRGYRVLEADRGSIALAMLKEHTPDLVILDAMLPEVHGFDIAKKMKGSEKYGSIPIVMISAVYRGWRFAEDVKASYGVEVYLEKPFKMADVVAAVEGALERRGEKQDPERISEAAEKQLTAGIEAYKRGDVTKAIEHLKEGTRIDPLAYRLHFHLGLLYGKEGRIYDAIGELQTALEINGGHFSALKNLAVLYQKAGFRNKAIETWERALRVAPDDPTRQSIKEHLVGLL